MVLILVEGCIAPHVYSESYLGEAAAVALYSIAYIVWNQITYEVNGCWPYTFQEQLDSPVLHTAYVVVLFLFIGAPRAARRPRLCCCRDGLGPAQWGCILSGGAATSGARSRAGDRPTRSGSHGGGCLATSRCAAPHLFSSMREAELGAAGLGGKVSVRGVGGARWAGACVVVVHDKAVYPAAQKPPPPVARRIQNRQKKLSQG